MSTPHTISATLRVTSVQAGEFALTMTGERRPIDEVVTAEGFGCSVTFGAKPGTYRLSDSVQFAVVKERTAVESLVDEHLASPA